MASDQNHDLVNKTKKLLQEYGHEVKTTHLYEVFSKLANEASWNVAKAKGTNFTELLLGKAHNEIEDKIITLLKEGLLKDSITLGKDESNEKFKKLDPIKQPGLWMLGAPGSGKTVATKFTLLTHMLGNSDETIYFLYDPSKTNNYSSLEPKLINIPSEDMLISLIDLMWDELEARKEIFKKMNINTIEEYQKATINPLNKIVIVIENFELFTNSEKIKFMYKAETVGTIANKLKTMMQICRNYGMFFILTSVSSTYVPRYIRNSISNILVFRSNSSADSSLLGFKINPSDISIDSPGKCYLSDHGFMDFPLIDDSVIHQLLSLHVKPLIGEFIKKEFNEFIQSLKVKPNTLAEAIKNAKPHKSKKKTHIHRDQPIFEKNKK